MTESIKFYYNGIRVNGEKKLIKLYYSLDNNADHAPSVSLDVADYSGSLPRDLFEVYNDTDIYTDYFDSDHAYLTPEHPLYKYARFAAEKAKIRELKSRIAYLEKAMVERPSFYCKDDFYKVEVENCKVNLAELERHKDPGHPTAEDLEEVHQRNAEAENARIAARQEEAQKAREHTIACKNLGRLYIEDIARKHPIKEGEPVVTINWSENPAFYSWEDGELKLSVAAAEIILTHFDKEVHAEKDRGYDKTSFTIEFVNEDGEQDTYEGRYDLGDDDGGMIEHIRSFGRYYQEKGRFGQGPSEEDLEMGGEIVAIADMLERYTECGRIVNVTLAPWEEQYIEKKRRNGK